MQKAEDADLLNKLAKSKKWRMCSAVKTALRDNNYVIVVTDRRREIVFATHNIFEMTGYTNLEVKGKSPKMFQGTRTDLSVVSSIRDRIDDQQPFDTIVVNYRKNGEQYNCHILGFPVFDSKNELVNFIAFEKAA